MSKPIMVTIEVEEIAFGRVWRALDTMNGVINIKLHGRGPKPQNAVKPKKNGKSTTAECLVLGVLSNGNVGKSMLMNAVLAGGKAKTSLPYTLTQLKKKKHIVAMKGGDFKITPTGVKRYEDACVINEE